MYYLKNKINRIFIGVLFLVLSACNDDFLETKPLTQVSPKTFFKTKSDLRIFTNQFYHRLPRHGSGNLYWADGGSDNVPVNNARVRGESRVPASGGGYSWGDIRRTNYFLEKVKENGHDKSTDEDIKQYIGEAYFFRAWWYYSLLMQFGDLPWIDKTLKADIKELALPRISRKTIVENMVGDLDKAIANMKDGNAGAYSRLNKQVAKALKARICLYEGTWEKYHKNTSFGAKKPDGTYFDGTQFIQWAADTAKEIMDSGKYELYKGSDPSKIEGDEYFSLFNKLDYSGNKEIIFWAKASFDKGLGNSIAWHLGQAFGGSQLTKSFVDDYLMADGTKAPDAKKNATGFFQPFTPDGLPSSFVAGIPKTQATAALNGGWSEKRQQLTFMSEYTKILNVVKGRDPRFFQSIFHLGTLKKTGNPAGIPKGKFGSEDDVIHYNFGLEAQRTSYMLVKGLRPEWLQAEGGGHGNVGSILFRYAEILLIYAEAKAELGDAAAAKMAIDQLRERVGMAKLSTTMPSGSDVLKEVRRERRIELVGEGFRFYDLLRWRKAHEVFGEKRKKPYGVKWTGNTDLQARYKKDFQAIINIKGTKSSKKTQDQTTQVKVNANGFVNAFPTTFTGYNFDKDVDYLLPINNRDISLSEGKLKQNPGWEKRN